MNIDPDFLKDGDKDAPAWLVFLARLQVAALIVAVILWALGFIG